MENSKSPKVLLVGWDAADWKIINPLMDKGLMPTLERLVNQGVMGDLATLEPPFSPMLWTSVATGVRPDKHGILGFSEPAAGGRGVRPVSSLSRRVKAIWNILTQVGKKAHVVGWWPSHPAEPIDGVMVSNHFHLVNQAPGHWKLPAGAVHPPDLARFFAELRVHPSELSMAQLLPFVPRLAEIDQAQDSRPYQLAKILAEAASIQNAATWILEHQPWDFVAVYWDSLDHFSHGFIDYHPPRLPHVSPEDFELYRGVVEAAYCFHDMMLGRLLQLAGPQVHVLLISDHGFHSDHLRPASLPDEPAGPSYQHRGQGILCAAGPGIRRDQRVYGANLLDITPTLLTLFGLPVGQDMEGLPLEQIFEQPPAIARIPSWEQVPGPDGRHPEGARENTYDTAEALEQLIELGYIEDPGPDLKLAVENTLRELDYNLARVYAGSGRHALAAEIFARLAADFPDEPRFALRLIRAQAALGRHGEALRAMGLYRQNVQRFLLSPAQAQRMGEALRDAGPASPDQRDDAARKTRRALRRAAQEQSNLLQIEVMEAEILLKQDKAEEALGKLRHLASRKPHGRWLNLRLGESFLALGRGLEAGEAFRRSLHADPDAHRAWLGLAKVELALGNPPQAIELALKAIGLVFNAPHAHLLLGKAMLALGREAEAASALELALALAPRLGLARNLLVELYEKSGQHEKARAHRAHFAAQEPAPPAAEAPAAPAPEPTGIASLAGLVLASRPRVPRQEAIVVVSGLPRSGTSLLMQMLEAGGQALFADGHRPADANNPRGYHEHEAAKRLHRDKAWLPQAQGKAVKVILQQLFHLPARHNYRVLLVLRDLREVVMSQQRMLARDGKLSAENQEVYPYSLEEAYRGQMRRLEAWLPTQHNMDVLVLRHADLLAQPLEQARRVRDFLRLDADPERMAATIDPALHREKA